MKIGKMGKHIGREDLRFYNVYAVESEANNRINYVTDFKKFIIFRSEEDKKRNTHGDIIMGFLWEMPMAIKYMKSPEEKVELIEMYEDFVELQMLGGEERWKN